MTAAGAIWVRSEERAEPGSYVLSGWWRRAGGFLVDATVVGGIGIVVRHALFGHHLSVTEATISTLISTAIGLAYFAPLMIASNGRTLGKFATGIRVMRTDLKPINLGRVFRREAVLKSLFPAAVTEAFVVAGGSPGFSLVGLTIVMIDYLWPLWDRERRAIHDVLAETRVVLAGSGGE